MLNLGLGMLLVVSASAASAQMPSIPITVNCDNGQSLNQTLSRLIKSVPTTVSVSGTCTEFVQVIGFKNLTLNGLPGAALVQPSTGAGNLANYVLFIGSSQSVTVSGFSIQANTTAFTVGIGHGSSDIRLENLNVQGNSIVVFEHSQVLLSHVVAQDAPYDPLSVYDLSDVHVEHCQFQNTTGALWHAGMDVGASHVTMFDTTIGNMQVGINAYNGSIIDLVTYNTYTPSGGPSDVVIDNPAGTNFWGVSLSGGSSLNVASARLLINQPGQPWGGMTGGILVSNGSTLSTPNDSNNLIITGSHGQGIVVENNSHATLTGATITGSAHGGVVLANLSSVDVSRNNPTLVLTNISGSGVADLFCDSGSTITGAGYLAGGFSSQCSNVLGGEAVLP
jgi:hypothetical protein